MPSQNPAQEFSADAPSAAGAALREDTIEYGFIGKLQGLKYTYRRDISDRASLENNFRENKATMDAVLPEENLRGFKGQYLETAKKLKEQQGKTGGKDDTTDDPVDQIDFEFVLFASAVIDYDYIMSLIACYSAKGPGKSKRTREELIGLISADAKFIHERDDIAEYIGTLQAGEGLSETAIREGYTRFQAEKNAKQLAAIAARHGLATEALQTFVDGILDRMIFDGERLSDLMAPLDLGWRARTQAELALMEDIHPYLTQRAGGRDISGLSAYE